MIDTKFLSIPSIDEGTDGSPFERLGAAIVAGWKDSGINPAIFEKFKALQGNVFKQAIKQYTTNADDFVAVIHGEMHTKHVLFKYDGKGNVQDAKLINFMKAYVGAPMNDFAKLIFSASNENVREQQWNQLLEYYQQVVADVLKKLCYPGKIPTIEIIRNQFFSRGIYPALTGFFRLNERVRGPSPPAVNTLEFILKAKSESEIEKLAKLMSEPAAANISRYELEYFYRNGLLNKISV